MITIAVIGFGYWGPNIVRNVMALPGARISWVCDVNPKALSLISPSIRVTKRIEEVLEDKKTDAVIIVTPPSSHFSLAKKALESNKHVLVEKPMTTTSKDAATLAKLAKMKKKTLMVDHTFLYTPAVRKLKEIIDRGTLGQVFYVDSVRTNLGLFQKDSNVIADLSVHDFSIMDYLFGMAPSSITAVGARHLIFHQETVAYVSARYPNNLFFHGHVSWLSPVKIRTMIFVGTKKMLVYDDIEPSEKIKIYDKNVTVTHDLRVGYRSGAIAIPHIGVEEGLYRVVAEFARAIQTGKPPISSGTQGALVVRSIEEATKSLL